MQKLKLEVMFSTGRFKARLAVGALVCSTIVMGTEPLRPAFAGSASKKDKVGSYVEEAGAHGSSHRTHWGYTGNEGPAHWGGLSSKFKACSKGKAQSPINLTPSEGATVEPILFDYHASPLGIIHNGHTVQVSYQPGSSIQIGEKTYDLLQFHFHTPSEHSLKGERTDMEVHFVHRSKEGEIAVVGVLMKAGTYNKALAEIWKRMPARESAEQIHRNVMINAADLLPKRKKYFRYMGSLTTPPCTEGVHWYVLDTPVTVSESQTRRFSNAVGQNSRPTQALNHRLLLAPRN